MIKVASIALALLTGLTASAATARPLGVAVQGRPHDGGTAGDMLLYRSHLTDKKYRMMRMHNDRRDAMRRRHY